jgi:hypothetical protein
LIPWVFNSESIDQQPCFTITPLSEHGSSFAIKFEGSSPTDALLTLNATIPHKSAAQLKSILGNDGDEFFGLNHPVVESRLLRA